MKVGSKVGEVCVCGHPMYVHHANGKCEITRLNCLCSRASALLVTNNLESFMHEHIRGSMGHALMRGVVDAYSETTLALGPGAQEFRCYRCKRLSWELAPLLMDTHSKQITDNPEQGRMSRLWCRECIETSGRDYPPYLGFLIYREAFGSHHVDS
jgi:hypothetical protein